MSSYNTWRAKQFVFNNIIFIAPAVFLIGGAALVYFYIHAPVIGETARRERALDAAEARMTPVLDRKMDRYIQTINANARIAIRPTDFVDKSPTPGRGKNSSGELDGRTHIVRAREWVRGPMVARVVVSSEFRAANLDDDLMKGVGSVGSGVYVTLSSSDAQWCSTTAKIIRAAAIEPKDTAKSLIETPNRMETACQTGGSLAGGPFFQAAKKEVIGGPKAWGISVSNSERFFVGGIRPGHPLAP